MPETGRESLMQAEEESLGRAVFMPGSAAESLFCPYDVIQNVFVEEPRVCVLELFISTLMLANLSMYFATWNLGIDRVVGAIVVLRLLMLGLIVSLLRKNFDTRVLYEQFFHGTNYLTNWLIAIDLVMVLSARLCMRLTTPFPGSPAEIGLLKATWVVYSLLYVVPYGFFLLIDGIKRSSRAFRIAMVIMPMTRVAADFLYYSLTQPNADDDLASFGQLENYVSAGSFSILTAMLPVLVACFSNKREFLVLAHQPKLRREATELELSEWVAATKVGSGLNYCAEHCSPDNPDLARAAADPPAPAPEEPAAEAPGPAGA